MFKLKKRLLEKYEIDSISQERDEFERIQVATCALLLEVAKSDYEFSSMEKTTIAAILKKEFQISAEAIEELMEIAKRRRKESIDLWEFTHLINENYSKEEKIKVVEAAWKVYMLIKSWTSTKIIWFTNWPDCSGLGTAI